MAKHINNGKCEKCLEFMNEWGVDDILRRWFIATQVRTPEMHTSCVGRNQEDQEFALLHKASKASFGKSPHNYTPSLAMDIFRLVVEEGKPTQASFNPEWYKAVIVPTIPDRITWGGYFHDIIDSPHFEIRGWSKIANKVLIWKKDTRNV